MSGFQPIDQELLVGKRVGERGQGARGGARGRGRRRAKGEGRSQDGRPEAGYGGSCGQQQWSDGKGDCASCACIAEHELLREMCKSGLSLEQGGGVRLLAQHISCIVALMRFPSPSARERSPKLAPVHALPPPSPTHPCADAPPSPPCAGERSSILAPLHALPPRLAHPHLRLYAALTPSTGSTPTFLAHPPLLLCATLPPLCRSVHSSVSQPCEATRSWSSSRSSRSRSSCSSSGRHSVGKAPTAPTWTR